MLGARRLASSRLAPGIRRAQQLRKLSSGPESAVSRDGSLTSATPIVAARRCRARPPRRRPLPPPLLFRCLKKAKRTRCSWPPGCRDLRRRRRGLRRGVPPGEDGCEERGRGQQPHAADADVRVLHRVLPRLLAHVRRPLTTLPPPALLLVAASSACGRQVS